LDVHGFVSQGFIKSTHNDYLVDSSRGSFAFTEVGINFTTQLTERLRVGLQLFAFQLGSQGNYNAKADWYYLDYRFRDSIGVRAGRVKLPYGLYNDVRDIDAARAPILLPTSVYPGTNREFFLAQTGGELYGYIGLGRAGALDYRLYGGTVFVAIPSQVGAPVQIASLKVPYVTGARLFWETPIDGLRLGGSAVALKAETTLLYPMPPPVTGSIVVYGGLASIEYVGHELLLASEYGQARSRTTSSDPTMFPGGTTVSEDGYALGAYRLTRWLQPAVYYSFLYPHRSVRSGSQNMQHDFAATLRFDINDYWMVKIEGHYMHGTAALSNAAVAVEDWGLFLIKTTAYF
jgi:hypothetical protein